MDESLLLSGEQLLDLKNLYREEKAMRKKRRWNSGNMSRSGKYMGIPPQMDSVVSKTERDITERFNFLGVGRSRFSRDLGSVEWCTESKSSKVIEVKKRHPWMGFKENGLLKYTPEETIYLMESEAIQVFYSSIPLSLQSAYKIILSEDYMMKYYRIYVYLTRLGSKLVSSASQNEWQNRLKTGIDRNRIIDTIVKKINQQRRKSLSIVNGEQLELVKVPLRRKMFLNGTNFAKTATWSEYKRLIQSRSTPSEILDEEATVLELNDQIRSTENIFNQLPNCSLIDSENDLRPLIDQTKALDLPKLNQILRETGPQENELHKLLPLSKLPPEIRYRMFKPSTVDFSASQPAQHIIMCKDEIAPMVQELLAIDEECGQSDQLYAVTSYPESRIYTLEPFELWEEKLTIWDKSIG